MAPSAFFSRRLGGAADPFQPGDLDPLHSALAANWGWIALRGVLAVLFGLLALAFPGPTLLSLVMVFAAFMTLDGIFLLIAGARSPAGSRSYLLMHGLLHVVIGAAAFLLPGVTVLAFVFMAAAWAIIGGGFMFAGGLRVGRGHGRPWMLFGGIASLLYGIALAIAPLLGALVLTWWLGIYALVLGVTMIVLALRLRRPHDHPADHRPPAAVPT